MGHEYHEKVISVHTSSILHGAILGCWFNVAMSAFIGYIFCGKMPLSKSITQHMDKISVIGFFSFSFSKIKMFS
jgi:hypothetical protein